MRSVLLGILGLSAACGGAGPLEGDASISDAAISDAIDAPVFQESGCGGIDGGCGCGKPPPVYDAGETLASDLAVFDGAAPDGACPPLTFGVPWGDAAIAGAVVFGGCKNTTLTVTSACSAGTLDYMVFDLQGNIVGATQMSTSNCISKGPPPDYFPCGADASGPPPCEVLCGCNVWGCKPAGDAGTVTDGGAD